MSKMKIKQEPLNNSENTLLSNETEKTILSKKIPKAIQENIDETMLQENKENTVAEVNPENTVAENNIVNTVPENNMNKEMIQNNDKNVESQNDIKGEELEDIVQQYDIQEVLAKNNVKNEVSQDNINNIMPQNGIENVVSHNIIGVSVMRKNIEEILEQNSAQNSVEQNNNLVTVQKNNIQNIALQNNLLDIKSHNNVETIAPENDNTMLQGTIKLTNIQNILQKNYIKDEEQKENAVGEPMEWDEVDDTVAVDEVDDDNDGILLNNAANDSAFIKNIAPIEIVNRPEWVINARKKLLRHSVEWNDSQKVIELLDESITYLHGVDEWNRSPLYLAVLHQRPLLVNILLDKGADVNIKDNKTEMTPLHIAVKNKDEATVKLLLAHRANVDEVNKYNVTPLHLALESANEDIMKLLLEYEANVHVTKHGKSLIILAVESGCMGLAKLLHDNGCDINFVMDNGQTALHLATELQNIKMIKMLLDLGARCNIRTSRGSALDIAARKANCSVIRLLLHGLTDFEDRQRIGIPALNIAFQHMKQNVVHTLLMCGIDPRKQHPDRKCFLHMAIELDWAYTVSILLDKGVDANSTTCDKITALHIAVDVGNTDIINMLIKKGADINTKTGTGATALYIAVQNARVDIAKLLLEADADPDITDEVGIAPIHLAFEIKSRDIVYILLDHQANPNIRKFRKLPLELAMDCEWLDVIHRLLTKGANVNTLAACNWSLLIEAVKRANIEMIKMLLDFGADIEAKDKKTCMTPLQYAIVYSTIEVTTFLLDRGADLNYATPCGVTGLQMAFSKHDPGMVRLLLEREAIISTIFGKSPLHVAMELKWPSITRMLLDRGCDPNECTNTFEGVLRDAMRQNDAYMEKRLSEDGAKEKFKSRGYSLLHIAAEKGLVEIADLLLDNGVNVNCQDFDDSTPLHVGLKNGHDEFALKLIERGANLRLIEDRQKSTTLHIAVEGNCHETVKMIIKKRVVNINTQDNRGMTALYIAAAKDSNFLMELLLKSGAKIDMCNGTVNCTVLHYVFRNKNRKMAKMLLLMGMPIHCHCRPMDTVMGLALHTLKENWMVKMLLERDLEDRVTIIGHKAVEMFMPHIIRLPINSPYVNWLLLHVARKNGQIQEYDCRIYSIPLRLRRLHDNFYHEVRQMMRDEEMEQSPYYRILIREPMMIDTLERSQEFVATIEQEDYQKRYPFFSSVLQESMERIKTAAESACGKKKKKSIKLSTWCRPG